MYTDIRIDGESLDLSDNVRIPIDLFNPHLSYETIPNSRANIPNIPFSVRNQRIFEYAEMPQAGNDLYSYDCEIIYNGALVYHGKAYVKSANPLTGYQLEAGDDLGRFFGVYQDTVLTELDLGTLPRPETLPTVIDSDGESAFCFPTILNLDYYGTNGAMLDYSGYVNDYEAETGYTASGPKVPVIFVKFLLQQIAALTGIQLSGNFLTHPTWSKLLLTNWRAMDTDTEITVNKHVPAWTIPFLLLELRKVPNLELVFDTVQKKLSLNFWEEKLNASAVQDWTLKATPGHEKYPEFNRRLQLAFELDGGDSLMKDKPEIMGDYITSAGTTLGGDAIGLVKVPFRLTTFMSDLDIPRAKQTGVTKEFNQLSVTTAPRLLFWHGVIGDFPTALPELDNIGLYLNGPNGIAAKSWKRTEQLRKEMFYLKKGFVLTETDLALLDFTKPIHYNGLNYLVAHISGELPFNKEFICLLVKV